MNARRTLPSISLLEGATYVSAANTDIRGTFATAEQRAPGGPRTRPMVYLAGSPPGCTGNCDQGRRECNCPLAMPEPVHTEPQPLETTPDSAWDGLPYAETDWRALRWYAVCVAVALAAFAAGAVWRG